MIRVLRLIEYTYEDNTRAEEDMARWQIPPIGSRRHGNMTLRSTIITDLNYEPIAEDDAESETENA
jgi:hypothetical protein